MKHRIPYMQPDSLINLDRISIDQLRIDISRRIHAADNRSSFDAFFDSKLVYIAPWLLHAVIVRALPHLYRTEHVEYTQHRREVVASAVERLKAVGAIEESLLDPGFYCAQFRICLGRGLATPRHHTKWLIPIRPEFFWSQLHQGVATVTAVRSRRRKTGLADINWVVRLSGRGGSR